GTVVGDVSMQTPASREDFIATGLSHLTAVSGANVAIVTGAAVAACLTLGFHRRWALTAAAVALAGYVALVGPEPSVLRAGVMGTVGLVAMLTAHWSDILAALSAAVIVLSLLMPGQVVTYAFCLSVIATLGIVVLSPWIAKKVLRGWKQVCECHWDRFPTQAEAILVRMVCVAIAADIVTLPIIVHMTGKISIVAVVANVAVAWAVPIVTLTGLLAAPLCALATHTVLPDWFGRLTLAPAAPPANWIVWVADHLARIPMILTPGGWPWTLLLLANLALSIATIRWWRSWRFWRWSWLFLGLIWAFAWRWGILSFDISYPVTM
ncbi:MAG TPA: ComEC/Rec2 family competence protein, partial [Candidatus Corynebacterium gallistercoris]|nr:ComEC/Rec2 family competence protein [Candidatus Corynebacterium gallistercoris]